MASAADCAPPARGASRGPGQHAETAAGRGGSSASEPIPRCRRNCSVVTRNDGRPRPPKRASSAIKPRASRVSATPPLSVPRMWLMSARETGCSSATMASTSRAARDSGPGGVRFRYGSMSWLHSGAVTSRRRSPSSSRLRPCGRGVQEGTGLVDPCRGEGQRLGCRSATQGTGREEQQRYQTACIPFGPVVRTVSLAAADRRCLAGTGDRGSRGRTGRGRAASTDGHQRGGLINHHATRLDQAAWMTGRRSGSGSALRSTSWVTGAMSPSPNRM